MMKGMPTNIDMDVIRAREEARKPLFRSAKAKAQQRWARLMQSDAIKSNTFKLSEALYVRKNTELIILETKARGVLGRYGVPKGLWIPYLNFTRKLWKLRGKYDYLAWEIVVRAEFKHRLMEGAYNRTILEKIVRLIDTQVKLKDL